MSLNIILIEKSLVKKEKVSVLICEGVNQEILDYGKIIVKYAFQKYDNNLERSKFISESLEKIFSTEKNWFCFMFKENYGGAYYFMKDYQIVYKYDGYKILLFQH